MGDGKVNGKQGGAACERDGVVSKCPECGSARSERTPATPWAVRHRLKVKCAALLLVFGFVVVQNVRTWPVMPVPRTYVRELATFPVHRYTRSDIERYASGETKDGQLLADLYGGGTRGVFDYSLDDFDLEVAFISPVGFRYGGVEYGWPAKIAGHGWQGDYDDVYTLANPVYGTSDMGLNWSGLNFEFRQRGKQGQKESFYFSGTALAAPILLMLVSWNVGRALRLAFFALRATDKDGTRLRDRLLRRAPLLCTGACAIVTVVASLQPIRNPEYLAPKNLQSNWVRTGLTTGDLKRPGGEPDGEAEVALAILETTRAAAVQEYQVLIISFTSEVGWSSALSVGGWPNVFVFHTTEKADRAKEDHQRSPRVSLDVSRYGLHVSTRWGNPIERIDRYIVTTRGAAKIGFGLCVTWWLAGVAIWLVNKRARRQANKRAKRGLCTRCGYDLTGI